MFIKTYYPIFKNNLNLNMLQIKFVLDNRKEPSAPQRPRNMG